MFSKSELLAIQEIVDKEIQKVNSLIRYSENEGYKEVRRAEISELEEIRNKIREAC